MLRNFTSLISEAVDEGCERGVTLFTEALETDLQKDVVFEEHGLTDVVGQLFEEAGYQFDYDEELTEEEVDQIRAEMDPYFQTQE